MSASSRTTLGRARRHDKIARWVVTLGGAVVIVSVLGILLLILGTTVPLFLPARSQWLAEAQLPGSLTAQGTVGLGMERSMDGQLLAAHLVGSDGFVTLLDMATGEVIERVECGQTVAPAPKQDGRYSKRTVRSVESIGPTGYSLLWSDGTVSLVEIAAPSAEGRKALGRPKFVVRTQATAVAERNTLTQLAILRRSEQGAVTCARLLTGNRIVVTREITSENLLGEQSVKTDRFVFDRDIPGRVTAMTLDRQGDTLYAGTEGGGLLWWRFGEEGRIVGHDVVPAFRDKRAVTSLAMMLGDATLAVGDAHGEVTNWFLVRSGDASARKLRCIRTLAPHDAPIRDIMPSSRNRTLAVLDADGSVSLDYATSQRRLLTLDGDAPLVRLALAPRGDAVVALDAEGTLTAWQIVCPHPEVSWRTLLGKVFYEGYDRPDYVWQTTGGEEYEAKFSLVPLLFGTMKGTAYAMLLAVPLALAAAAYVSHFTTPNFKGWIKPAVEIMAAVPSVVIGFLVALWLAPRIERGLVALGASFVTVPAVFLVFLLLWQVLRRSPRAQRAVHGREFLVMAPILALGIVLAVALAAPVEQHWFGGNLRLWLAQNFGLRYDQRNNILIGFGLGFTVIPIIFSLAEDALSNVPHSMTAASMALGGSRWQTLWRVVLPSASPGIFAAVMIGFGRAVGETMIVLMATGNTPIIDWSPLDGMRTLSANIAVEIPEAPVGGTLYRVLFLCAVLLFVLTFILNTVAEVVRQRLRKRFGQFQ